ncbi:unnamed protein product [Fraxinus pennsylvanica]|uniref:Glycine-rich protein n=1 Tax=Fraxinus pennsylvanica TaxID=56036 RepID=A0AAD2AFC6_9LAMI|nr:unnamed protein product [Fraxinus pennsylvanica]
MLCICVYEVFDQLVLASRLMDFLFDWIERLLEVQEAWTLLEEEEEERRRFGDFFGGGLWCGGDGYGDGLRIIRGRLRRKRVVAAMAYVERGVVKSKRSIWRLRTITDFFWAIVNFIGVFFTTMFSMEKSDAYRKVSGTSKKWDGGGPGGPGGGPYGSGPRGPPRGIDNVSGIDHNSLPACGSCCG